MLIHISYCASIQPIIASFFEKDCFEIEVGVMP
jgi:hypothetical protein